MYVSAALCKNSALSSKKYHYPRFINSLIKEKLIAWKRWKHSKLTEDKLRYKKAALDCKTAISKFHAAKETELIRSNNIGSFYNFDNSRLKSRSRIHDIRRPDGSFAFSSDEKAKIFNTFLLVFSLNNVVVGAGIWYRTNPVPDLRDTRTWNRRYKQMESIYWRRFLERVSWVLCVFACNVWAGNCHSLTSFVHFRLTALFYYAEN